MALETVLMGVIVAVVYSLSMYMKNSMNSENPETFDWFKAGSTTVVGGLVGLLITQTGVLPTEVGVETQLATMAGVIVMVENVLKIVYRAVAKYAPV